MGGAVRRYSGRGVCYGHGVSGRGVGKVVDVKLSEARARGSKRGGYGRVGREMYYI